MKASPWQRLLAADRQLLLFLTATAFLGMAGGIFETTFNNFLNDTFHLAADVRGRLEFPRELPGFLCAVVAGSLFFLAEVRVAAVAGALIGLGMWGLAATGHSYARLLTFMILWSTGMHLFMPLSSAIGLRLAARGRRATRLGQLGGVSTAATIIGCGFVWWAVDYVQWDYSLIFFGGGLTAFWAVWALLRMKPPEGPAVARPKFFYHPRYRLYYLLCILFGARKQVFITFGPWVLVKVFGQPASTFARLWILAALVGTFFKPLVGHLIDRWGERRLLMLDALILGGVCLGYGFAQSLFPPGPALAVVCLCYILDQLLFALGIARATYVDKIAPRKEEVTATFSLGVTLDHAVSMSLPALGGWIWMRYGYPFVFLGAAGIAALTLTAASFMRGPK
ncbi:MAG TPA: MFS transporter [Armatimonadetes bacterium]|nr:MFS transporter [Armatimonadota bacterium]